MRFLTYSIVISLAILLNILPSYAGLNGKVSKGHFFDTKKTIMYEEQLDTNLKTGKFWDMNFLYFNKYRPIFMLSNKELIDFRVKETEYTNYAQSAKTPPAIYNVSLKNASVKTVSLSKNEPKEVRQDAKATEKKIVAPKITAPKTVEQSVSVKKNETISNSLNKPNTVLYRQYEKALNPNIDTEYRIRVAKMLKATNKKPNYEYALNILNAVTQKEPYNAYAFYLKGEVYFAKNDSKNAMSNYVQSLKINPINKDCCFKIAKLLEPTNKSLSKKYYNQGLLLSEK